MDKFGGHTPVLLEESVEALRPSAHGVFVDCTFGRGGHSKLLLERTGPTAKVLGLDRDPEAVAAGAELAAVERRFTIRKSSFGELTRVVSEEIGAMRVQGVLFDLGVSSPQLDQARRGFSFQEDGPLDMRMDPDSGLSAAEWLHKVSETELIRVLRDYGEERYARRIARAILAERARRPIDTTMKLADIVANASPTRERGKSPATRTFQALRIRVNNELDELARGLRQATDMLENEGRLVVISFHSLEDRIVKRFMRSEARPDTGPFPVPIEGCAPRLRLVGKPIRASDDESTANPRARSAMLRVAERLA